MKYKHFGGSIKNLPDFFKQHALNIEEH